MAPAQRLVAARSRTIPTAHAYWVRDRQRDRPRQLRASASPPTNYRTDRETGRSSSATLHRSRRRGPDKASARGERIRVASAAFPCLGGRKQTPSVAIFQRQPLSNAWFQRARTL